jgi:ATP-dependent DNA helicase RecG
MVLNFVTTYGQITRSEAAELCLLQPAQTRALRARMVRAGKLELRGSKRGSHYIAALTRH